ncbi:hypothetical protein LTR50_004180 [Elasticomyces elasticus]|nr:hypothetical protein LTR50_004180 [Elasticomyces elasticus]
MSTPIDERGEPSYTGNTPCFVGAMPSYNVNNVNHNLGDLGHERSSEEERTVVGEENIPPQNGAANTGAATTRPRQNSRLSLQGTDYDPGISLRNITSHTHSREQAHRLDDDLAMLKVERQVSKIAEEELNSVESNAKSMHRSRSRREDVIDDFDVATNPIHEKTALYKPPEHPIGNFSKFVKRVHGSSFLVRYLTYILPLVLILLIPLLLGAFVFKGSVVGGVDLVWFMIWLEIVWLTLWAGRILAKCLPWPIGLISSLFTNNSKKWRDMGKQLELPATIFFWWLGIEISFLPTMKYHQRSGSSDSQPWMITMNKVLISFFVSSVLNFVEKIIIQLIAISFHLRTYQDRIELNKFQIGSLTKLYSFSKEKIAMEDSEFEGPSAPGSGARTPAQYLQEAQKQTKEVFSKFGDVAGKIAGDFTGKQVTKSTHPHQVILTLLSTTGGSQILARRLYRTFAREETETVYSDDLRNAFENDDEANAAFSMFDKDMNGDISMEELESVCVEIGRERKAITASLKDLDSVVGKLDSVFMFVVFVITLLVFISLISTSAAGVLTSAGSTVLALSWLFSATAQEFLQSVIFVFVKHPFDVGDRVGIYGNTGALGRGDDYFVKEISLLYTEFKKMEGHVVQAPNSYLNTLFILNQRRSGGLAEAVSITIKFGTTLDQIDQLRQRLLDFVKQEKREYQANILTELRDVVEAHAINLNVVFFYKSNWQNEGLRLARRNKFICAMMVTMQELGIEGPRMRYPGQKESFPVYLQNMPPIGTTATGQGDHAENPTGWQEGGEQRDPPFVPQQEPDETPPSATAATASQPVFRTTSALKHSGSTRPRGESLSAMHRRVDFSLGMRDIASGDVSGDVYEDRSRPHLPSEVTSPPPESDYRNRSSSSQDNNNNNNSLRRSDDLAPSASRSSSTNNNNSSSFNPSNLLRRSTTDGESRVRSPHSLHRARFFGRNRAGTTTGPDLQLRALEGGVMADIPESAEGEGRGERLEAWSGNVGGAGVGGWRMGGGGEEGGAGVLVGGRGLGRSATDGVEMRRFR